MSEFSLDEVQREYLNGYKEVEWARQFTNPTCADDLMPIPWPHSAPEPDKSKRMTINGHPTRWVYRTVTYGPWVPVEP